jgi:hypothetical protein
VRKWQKTGGKCIMGSLMNCVCHYILLDQSDKQEEMGGACGTNGKRETYAGVWWKNVKSIDLGVDGNK